MLVRSRKLRLRKAQKVSKSTGEVGAAVVGKEKNGKEEEGKEKGVLVEPLQVQKRQERDNIEVKLP